MAQELSKEELDERVAILKRFRSLLEEQRNKFREYLMVLENQQGSIESENTTALLAHTELEQEIVKNIVSLQKVVVPMENLYHASRADQMLNESAAVAEETAQDAASINSLQADLAHLQDLVLAQNQKNRDALKEHITSIKAQLNSMKNPYRHVSSVYAHSEQTGNFVQIQA